MGVWVKQGGSTLTGDGGGGVGTDLPNAILGDPVIATAFAPEDGRTLLAEVTIPVSFADDDFGAVDRLLIFLAAPDNTVDTQAASVGGPDEPGIVISDDENEASKIVPLEDEEPIAELAWSAGKGSVRFTHPAPVGAPKFWRAWVVSANKRTRNKIESSPNVRFEVNPQSPDVSGVEWGPLALSFRLIDPETGADTDEVSYETIPGGHNFYASFAWENDANSPRFAGLGGYDLVVEYEDGTRTDAIQGISANRARVDAGPWPVGAPAHIIFYLVTYGSGPSNPRNSIIPGLTPSVRVPVAAPTGSAGQEHVPLVQNFQLVDPHYVTDADKKTQLWLPFIWGDPEDTINFGGAIIYIVRGDGIHYKLTGIETDNAETAKINEWPTAPEPGVFCYALSVSKGFEPNSYEEGVTPSTPPFTLQPPPTTVPPVDGFTATLFYADNEIGFKDYGFSGSWINPNSVMYAGFQGTKIYRAAADGTAPPGFDEPQALTGIETKQSFKTQTWATPKVPTVLFYLFAVSVDKDGKEAPIGTSPRQGPFIVSPQGGVIANEALPEIQVANFAAGIEPVSFVNSAPDTAPGWAAYLPAAITKTTTAVFNHNNQTLYRWQASVSRYKKVGGGGDLEADSVSSVHLQSGSATIGKIAAGAVRSIEMAANEILVGQYDGITPRPVRLLVQTPGTMIGLFGEYFGWQGIYALNARFGPNFSAPTFESSAAGVTITNANFSVNASGSTISISPSYFDATYSVLAVRATDAAGSSAHFMSRGIATFQGGLSVGSLNREISNPFCGELVLYNSGSIVILAQGSTGVVRANGGFQVGANPGQTLNLPYTRANGSAGTMVFVGGILAPGSN